jgi:hypothetical protein
MTPFPTQSNLQAALASFLAAVLPSTGSDGLPLNVIVAEQNRIPSPQGADFVVMTPIRFERIETNVNSYADAKFTGSIAGTTLTVSAIATGKIIVNAPVFGLGVAPNTTIVAQLTGAPGSTGTYTIAPTQTVASETLSAGTSTIQQGLKATIQLDFHSADLSAGDLANTVSTLFRDGFAVNQFANQSPFYGVVPLYADDARQVPFTDEAQQVEWRWVLEALLQANVIVTVPQQFADSVALGLIEVA